MNFDCSPNVGERMTGEGASHNALIIAKKRISEHSDMNRYLVMCIADYKDVYEYVVWTMSANKDEYIVESGNYDYDILESAKNFARRAGVEL